MIKGLHNDQTNPKSPTRFPIQRRPCRPVARKDGIPTEDLLVNLTETLASAHALTCNFAFELDSSRREGALGVAQLIEVARLLAERVLEHVEPSSEAQVAY